MGRMGNECYTPSLYNIFRLRKKDVNQHTMKSNFKSLPLPISLIAHKLIVLTKNEINIDKKKLVHFFLTHNKIASKTKALRHLWNRITYCWLVNVSKKWIRIVFFCNWWRNKNDTKSQEHSFVYYLFSKRARR